MSLVIFDLDNTLIKGDSDYLWGEFLVENNFVDGEKYRRQNRYFYQQYQQAKLNIEDYLDFSLAIFAKYSMEELLAMREEFIKVKIKPIFLNQAYGKVNEHINNGDNVIVITATNKFIVEPIVSMYGIINLLATDIEKDSQRFTGKLDGIPCFREGKVKKLAHWLIDKNIGLEDSCFYTDSINDLPLLKEVDYPFVVNPDKELLSYANKNDWQVYNWLY